MRWKVPLLAARVLFTVAKQEWKEESRKIGSANGFLKIWVEEVCSGMFHIALAAGLEIVELFNYGLA